MRNWRAPILVLAAAIATPGVPWAQQTEDKELQELLGAPPAAAVGPASVRGSTASGISNAFNPAISLNGLVLGAGSDQGSSQFGLQEFELQFSSDIDPYFRADITFSIHQDFDVPGLAAHEHAEGEAAAAESGGIEVEQALITSLAIPDVTLRFGKFPLPFGKHNILHTHAFPFITRPVVLQELFGEEGLSEMAIDASPLLPLPFFSELNLVTFQGDNEELFQFTEAKDGPRHGPDKAKYLLHSRSLFDVTGDSTIELGLSYLSGTNNAGDGNLTTAYGGDFTFKHRPAIGRGLSAVVLQAEYIGSRREAARNLDSSGYYVSLQWRVIHYGWVQGRYGEAGSDEAALAAVESEQSRHTDFLIAWVPTEFSALRLQYSILDTGGDKANAWYLQYNFAIGSHPAHQY